MHHYLLFALFLLVYAHNAQAQCNPKEYTRIFKEASALQEKGEFIDAKNRYEAAKIYACNQQEHKKADDAVDKLFDEVNQLRQEAQIERDRANILAGYFQFKFNRSWAFNDGKYALIDRNGNRLTDFLFTSINPFDDKAMALVQIKKQSYFLDTIGVLSESYQKIEDKSFKGLKKVERDGRVSYVDQNGKRPLSWDWYDAIQLFGTGLGLAFKEDSLFIIDRTGKKRVCIDTGNIENRSNDKDVLFVVSHTPKQTPIEYRYVRYGYFQKMVIGIKGEKNYSLLNNEGTVLAKNCFDEIETWKDIYNIILLSKRVPRKFANIIIGKKSVHGLYIKDKGLVLPTKYDVIYPIGHELFSFYKFPKGGYIYSDGSVLTKPRNIFFDNIFFQLTDQFSNYLVQKYKDKWGLINKSTGKWAVLPKYKKLWAQFDENQKKDIHFLWFKRKGKWGLVDINGKELTKPIYKLSLWNRLDTEYDWGKYNDIYDFDNDNNTAWVKIKNKWTIIDTLGNQLFPPIKIKKPDSMFDGDVKWVKKGKKFALLDKHGVLLTNFNFKAVQRFYKTNNCVFAFNKNNKYIVNKNGEIFIFRNKYPISRYDLNDNHYGYKNSYESRIFRNQGFILLSDSDSLYIYNDRAEIIIKDKASEFQLEKIQGIGGAYYEHENRMNPVQFDYSTPTIIYKGKNLHFSITENKWLFKDAVDSVVLKHKFDKIVISTENRIFIHYNNKWGLINSRGEFLINTIYDSIQLINENTHPYYLAKLDNQWFLYNSEFKIFELGNYEKFDRFINNGNLLNFARDNKDVLVDTSGRVILIAEDYCVNNDGSIWYKSDNKWGLIDKIGNILYTPQFKNQTCPTFNYGMALVESDGLFGYIDEKYQYTITAKYDIAVPFQKNGQAWVILLGESFMINKKGEKITNK